MIKAKKIIFTLMLSCLVSILMVSISSATVVYDETTKRYYSTSEDDGIICFNGTALSEAELSSESYSSSGRYLENLVPTDIIPSVSIQAVSSTVVQPQHVKSQNSVTYEYFYTPMEQFFMFCVNASTSAINVVIKDARTGEVLSRAYNLTSGQYYKTSEALANRALCITYTTDCVVKSIPSLIFGSSNSAKAEIANPNAMERGTISSSSIPRNIDGKQGVSIGSWTTKGVTSSAGHTLVKATFTSTSDGMSSINLGWQQSDDSSITYGYIMNLKKGSSFKSWSVPISVELDLIASTNSTSGKQATITVAETAY